MKITKYEVVPEQELLARLKKVRLRGFDQAEVYKNAEIALLRQVDTDLLVPAQRYVLTPGVETILDLYDTFHYEKGVDIFALAGGLLFWTDEMDPNDLPIPLLPPVVEDDVKNPGLNLINDGMHRVWAARKRGRAINVVFVRNVPIEYPYYADPLEKGWSEVKEIQELTEGYKKKTYRNPDDYKALFRDFNEIFEGVQKDRKKTSSEELKR